MGLLSNLKKKGLKDITDPKKWGVAAEYATMLLHGLTLDIDEILPFSEQMVYRMQMCPQCVKGPECDKCGCAMPDGMVTPSNWCDGKEWIAYMEPDEWEAYKKKWGIVFSVMHIKEEK